MQKILFAILISIITFNCQNQKPKRFLNDSLVLQIAISPAFLEHAEINVSHLGDSQNMQFLLRDAYSNDHPADTFYFKEITLSQSQIHKIDTGLLKKIINGQSSNNRVVRDGIWLRYMTVYDDDTIILNFKNPQKRIDSFAFEIIDSGNDNLRSLFKDSVISDYLDDVQEYLDQKDTLYKTIRTIDKMRRAKYSR
jgi:hypothetical protein